MADKVTHLYNFHEKNARVTSFAGYKMPLWYKGIADEHFAVREKAGVFDVSHMARFEIQGTDATKFLDYITSADVPKKPVGKGFLSLLCNERGGIIDDTVSLKFSDRHYIMIANAVNSEKVLNWLERSASQFDVLINNMTENSAMIALQGPRSEKILQKLVDYNLSTLDRYTHTRLNLGQSPLIVSRTGYTGEDGFEIIVPDTHVSNPYKVEAIWNSILDAGKPIGLIPCGLGARDTLRLEAGIWLYGQDIDDTVTPIEAGVEFIVSLNKVGDFVGKRALIQQKEKGVNRIRTGLIMKDKGIPRSDNQILWNNGIVGKVTSGTYSPILRRGIAMGYLPPDLNTPNTELRVSVRQVIYDAKVVTMPFYDTKRYGLKREKTAP